MSETKTKYVKPQRITTEEGVARFPHLQKPDNYKNVLKWKCNLVLDGEDPIFDLLRDLCDAEYNKAKAKLEENTASLQAGIDDGTLKGKKLVEARKTLQGQCPSELLEVTYPFEPEYSDDGEETGNYILKASSKATYEDKKTKEIKTRNLPAFDASGTRLKVVPDVWGGSSLKLSLDLIPYHMAATNRAGISLRIAGFQIIDLKTGGGASAADLGFGAVEGGYAAEGLVNEASTEDAEPDTDIDVDEF